MRNVVEIYYTVAQVCSKLTFMDPQVSAPCWRELWTEHYTGPIQIRSLICNPFLILSSFVCLISVVVSIVKFCKLELSLCVFILNCALRVPLSYPWLNLLDSQIIQDEWKVVVHLSEVVCNEGTILAVTVSVRSGPTGMWQRPCLLPKAFLYGISTLPSQYAETFHSLSVFTEL
jgi:hypothetical protein